MEINALVVEIRQEGLSQKTNKEVTMVAKARDHKVMTIIIKVLAGTSTSTIVVWSMEIVAVVISTGANIWLCLTILQRWIRLNWLYIVTVELILPYPTLQYGQIGYL